jgi:signal transduction histidine kinase
MAKKKNLQLVNKVMPNSLAYFDANMVNTILRNLLSNAIKFTKDGGNITIGTEVSATVNNELVIYVKDTGVGIPNERIEKLFHIQSNYTTKGTSGENGTGLGLIIVRDFIERNNGKIWVESVENTGTTFYFTMKTSKE